MKPVERMQILNAKIFKNLAGLVFGVITTLHVVITIDQIAESPKVIQTLKVKNYDFLGRKFNIMFSFIVDLVLELSSFFTTNRCLRSCGSKLHPKAFTQKLY